MPTKAASKSGGSNLLLYGGIATVVLLIGGGVFMGIKAMAGTPNPNSSTPSSGGNTNSGDGSPTTSRPSSDSGGGSSYSSNSSNSGFPLQMGSKGGNVTKLQYALEGYGATIATDGIFGGQTLAALKQYTGSSSVANQSALDAIVNSQPSYKAAAASAAAQNTNPVCMCCVLGLNQKICTSTTACTPSSSTGIWCNIKKIF